MKKNLFVPTASAVIIVGSLALAVPAFADSPSPSPSAVRAPYNMMGSRPPVMGRPAVVGKVTAVNGSTITVSGRPGFSSTTRPMPPIPIMGSTTRPTSPPTVTFTVDATNATVNKNNSTSTISNIAVGDTIIVYGTVNGTNITATAIRDRVMMSRGDSDTSKGPNGGENGEGRGRGMGSSTNPGQPGGPMIQGNGQPVVAGTVSAVNGTTLSITNKSNVSYTVDASTSKVVSGQNGQTTASLLTVKVGDTVIVQGPVSGSSISASMIIDQTKPATSSGSPAHPGFFGGIGQFFAHLFGF